MNRIILLFSSFVFQLYTETLSFIFPFLSFPPLSFLLLFRNRSVCPPLPILSRTRMFPSSLVHFPFPFPASPFPFHFSFSLSLLSDLVAVWVSVSYFMLHFCVSFKNKNFVVDFLDMGISMGMGMETVSFGVLVFLGWRLGVSGVMRWSRV